MPAIITDTRGYFSGTYVTGSLAVGQTGDFEVPTPYTRIWGDLSHSGSISGLGVDEYDAARHLAQGAHFLPVARNRAWRKLVASMNDEKANLAIAAAEWQQTASMMSEKVALMQELYYAVFYPKRRIRRSRGPEKALLKKEAREAARRVGRMTKRVADRWLEYWFGWKPLASDIQSGLRLFDKPLPQGYIEGKGGQAVMNSTNWPPPTLDRGIRSIGFGVVHMGAKATVTNPNLYRANQLGLLNPLVLGTELIRFSFILDWLIDYGTWLESFTDFSGVSLEDPWTSSLFKAEQRAEWNPPGLGFARGEVGSFVRANGLAQPAPNLEWRSNVGTSIERLATSAALLVQLLYKELTS